MEITAKLLLYPPSAPGDRVAITFFVIPCKRSATRNPVFLLYLVPDFRRDDVWIPACAGMTVLMALSPITTQSPTSGGHA